MPNRANPLHAAVLDTCRRLIAEGVLPSEPELKRLFPRHGSSTLLKVRDALRAAGLLDWSGCKQHRPAALTGATQDERDEVTKGICHERARKWQERPPEDGRRRGTEYPAMKRVYRVTGLDEPAA